jgi:hypothetical protein
VKAEERPPNESHILIPIEKISARKTTQSLAMARRNSDSEAMTLLAVAVASPGTMRLDLTKKNPKGAAMKMTRYSSPATLADLLIEFIFLLLCEQVQTNIPTTSHALSRNGVGAQWSISVVLQRRYSVVSKPLFVHYTIQERYPQKAVVISSASCCRSRIEVRGGYKDPLSR